MKYLRYFREFYDAEDILYRIEILQESEGAYEPQEVTLASDPVTIEWPEVMKIDPVMASGATLRLISITDRQFVDLYTVEPCAIRLDIYRAGSLYWSGTLDTELFEEPYSYADRYVTEVTFADFGVLDRLSWEQKGLRTMREVINICLSSAQLATTEIVEQISTSIPDVEGALLDNCLLSLENFFDEDGKAWTIREVLDEVLRPFSLQLRQKNGRIYISDLNALSTLSTKDVKWLNADATLGVEPTYNKAVIRFSPYSEAVLFDGSFDDEKIIPNTSAEGISKTSVILPETEYNGFDIYYNEPYTEATEVQKLTISNGARLFRIKPDNSGSEATGVMWGIRPTGDTWIGEAPYPLSWRIWTVGKEIIRTGRIPILSGAPSQYIKLSLDVLLDVRLNPFESASEENEGNNWKYFRNNATFGLIPCYLFFFAKTGEVYSYTNYDIWNNEHGKIYPDLLKKGRWVLNSESYNILWLAYYNQGNREDETGFGGWQTNKQTIGFTDKEIPKFVSLNIEGEKIPLPPQLAGELMLEIHAGFDSRSIAYRPPENFVAPYGVAERLRWTLYRNPKIEIVTESGKTLEVEDIETSAWINKAAEEELPIDTYIGTPTERTPLARGAVISAKDYTAILKFRRADITDTLERLAIGTIYSNYASRRSTLEGTIRLIAENSILSDKSAVNDRFVIVSATENLQTATSEIKMAEFSGDFFEGIEYE